MDLKDRNKSSYVYDIALGVNVKYITKEEIEFRKKLFTKTLTERAKLDTLKAKHRVQRGDAKGLNSPQVQNQLLKQFSKAAEGNRVMMNARIEVS